MKCTMDDCPQRQIIVSVIEGCQYPGSARERSGSLYLELPRTYMGKASRTAAQQQRNAPGDGIEDNPELRNESVLHARENETHIARLVLFPCCRPFPSPPLFVDVGLGGASDSVALCARNVAKMYPRPVEFPLVRVLLII